MPASVRVQLQQGHDEIVPSETTPSLLTKDTLIALHELYKKAWQKNSDPKWRTPLTSAINAAQTWVKKANKGGGIGFDGRGGGAPRDGWKFRYGAGGGKEYRIDLELNGGTKDTIWWKE